MTDDPSLQALLQGYSEDELLCELRSREARATAADRRWHACPPTRLDSDAAPAAAARTQLRDIPALTLFLALRQMQKARYGDDDRRDIREVPQPRVLRAADAIAALFRRMRVRDNGDGTSRLDTLPLGLRYGLSPSEPFHDQPSGAFGSGFLVAPRLVATAGHCITAPELGDVRFVFGFRMLDDTAARLVIPNEDIYTGVRIVGREYDKTGPDWALIELDRDVGGRAPLPIRREGKIADAERLYVLGHPSGLPLKHADGAAVRDNSRDTFFVANLDTYAGSSGSPVLGPAHVVEGVVARGERDFVAVGGSFRSLVCPDNGGRGQDCIRTTEFAALVPR